MRKGIGSVGAAALGLLIVVLVGARHDSAAVAGGRDEAALAEAAAMAALNGVPASSCTADGQFPPPGRDTCIHITPNQAAQADRGLVAVQAFLAPDIQPLFAAVGRGVDGDWGLWYAAPAAYVPVQLPDAARLCGDGGVAVRSEPSTDAPVRATVADQTVATVNRFILSRPGTWQRNDGGTRGEGWYHISGAVDGWVAAEDVVVADADCAMALR